MCTVQITTLCTVQHGLVGPAKAHAGGHQSSPSSWTFLETLFWKLDYLQGSSRMGKLTSQHEDIKAKAIWAVHTFQSGRYQGSGVKIQILDSHLMPAFVSSWWSWEARRARGKNPQKNTSATARLDSSTEIKITSNFVFHRAGGILPLLPSQFPSLSFSPLPGMRFDV